MGHRTGLLLLTEEQSHEAQTLLASIGFADWNAAYRSLRRLATDDPLRPAMAACLPHLLAALSHAANPDRALVSFERFVRADADPAALLSDLAANPRTVEMLVTLFAGSQFLTEILLRQPQGYRELTDRQRLVRTKSAATFDAEARAAVGDAEDFRSLPRLLKSGDVDAALDALRRFQRWELLRLGACDFFGLLDLPAITMQLSHLADSIVRVCLDLATRETQTSSDGLAVIALGKLGGAELNYSSDIDLLFLAASDGSAYRRPAQRLIEMLGQTAAGGFLYRVDLRLRPWGRDGALVSTVAGHLAYLQRHARLWEKQALLKARSIAGDLAVGADFLNRAGPLLFDAGAELVRAEVHAVKQRIEAGLRRRGQEWGEVKLGEGSIRDVEFIAQAMQLIHGRAQPQVRTHNTLEALARLEAAGRLAPGERRTLEEGYVFLRSVEHALQLMDFRQTHALPADQPALAQLARRLGFTAADAGSTLVARYEEHRAAIRAIYNARLVEGDRLKSVEGSRLKVEGSPSDAEPSTFNLQPISNLQSPHAPAYEEVFSEAEIREHGELAARLNAGNLAEVRGTPLGDGRWRVTVVAYDYLGELSLICGLLFVYGFNILDGQVFSWERRRTEDGGRRTSRLPRRSVESAGTRAGVRRGQIVDVFTVRPVGVDVDEGLWERYGRDLEAFLQRLGGGEQHQQIQGELARRVAGALRGTAGAAVALSPVEIEIDNEASAVYSVLSVRAPDTVGFLYELTNALALNGIDIGRVTVETVGDRARDTLYVTDARGQKITAAPKQRELRAATVLVKHFTQLLPHAPDPAGALLKFREFLAQLFSRPGWPDELASLERPEVLNALARLLGVGDFLWEDFLRLQYDNLFPIVRDVAALAAPKLKDQLRAELQAVLDAVASGLGHDAGEVLTREEGGRRTDDGGRTMEERRRALNAFKDREMFRVDMRQILGHISEFGRFSAELSDLAEVVVEAASDLCLEELRRRFGSPVLDDGTPCRSSLCGLGKFGGRELGFASDIELLFIFEGEGRTTGPYQISASEFYSRLVQEMLETIRAKREGIFEIDLRLRPYGSAGSMAVALDAFERYFAPGGPAWPYERQALVKLRPVAGDPTFGERVVAVRDALLYSGEPFDVAAMRGMRQRQIRQLVAGGTVNAKFSPGGLVDVEYLVQGLQISHGHADGRLRATNTREAMAALAQAGLLAPGDYAVLREAHIFLRRLINALRVVRGSAKELTVPPPASEEFALLARRLGYTGDPRPLQDDLLRHTSTVQALSVRLLAESSRE